MVDDALQRRLDRLCADGDCCTDLAAASATVNEQSLLQDADTFAALGDPQRLRVVRLLQARPGLCGCELQAMLGVSHATVSHHMGRLRDAGLVAGERRGKWTHYTYVGPAGY